MKIYDTSFLKNQKVVIFGATGFVGAHLVRALLKSEANIVLAVRDSSNIKSYSDIRNRVEVIECDLLDEKSLTFLTQVEPDYVYNLAARGVDDPNGEPSSMFQVNTYGSFTLLNKLKETRVKKFIHVGTAYEYGCNINPIDEEALLGPKNHYAASKLAGSVYAQTFCKTDNLPMVLVRCFTAYGPGQGRTFFIPEVITSFLEGREVEVTSGKQIRDFLYIDDLITGLLLAAKGENGEVFNIGGGKGYSVKDVVMKIGDLLDENKKIKFGAIEHRTNEIWEMVADISKIKYKLGWVPQVSLEDGLHKTILFYK